MSENQGGMADPQDVPMAEKYGTHGSPDSDADLDQELREGTEKAFDAENAAPAPGPGREVSDEEREGVSATDTSAATPLGVGESINRGAEDVAKQESESGRHSEGSQGHRPVGGSDERDATSVDPG